MVDFENLSWEARKQKDRVLKEHVKEEVMKLVIMIVGVDNVTVKPVEEKYVINNDKLIRDMGFNPNKIKFEGQFWEYPTFGETELDVYLNILKRVANKNSVRYPIC